VIVLASTLSVAGDLDRDIKQARIAQQRGHPAAREGIQPGRSERLD